MLSLAAIVGAIVLSAFAVSYDQITKDTGDDNYKMFCGWQEFHKGSDKANDQNSNNDYTWKYYCSQCSGSFSFCTNTEKTDYCDMENIGKAWLGLMIVGIGFGAISAFGFLIDIFCCTSQSWALGSGTLYTICTAAAIIEWAAANKCEDLDDLCFNCTSQLSTSWYLALGGIALGILSHATYNWW